MCNMYIVQLSNPCHLTVQDTFEKFFKMPVTSPVLKIMWLLFLVAKARLLPRFPDLVTAFNMLLCVADFMVAHVQNAMAVIDFNDEVLLIPDLHIYILYVLSDNQPCSRIQTIKCIQSAAYRLYSNRRYERFLGLRNN